jgi:hypothetical protein
VFMYVHMYVCLYVCINIMFSRLLSVVYTTAFIVSKDKVMGEINNGNFCHCSI